jgi:hypothetical protein
VRKGDDVSPAGQQQENAAGSAKRPSSGPAESARVAKTLVRIGELYLATWPHRISPERSYKHSQNPQFQVRDCSTKFYDKGYSLRRSSGGSRRLLQTRSTASSLFNAAWKVTSRRFVLRCGLSLLLATTALFGQDSSAPVPRLDTYFIAADEVTWDYTPKGRSLTGAPRSDEGSSTSSDPTGRPYCSEYTDASYETGAMRRCHLHDTKTF